MRIVFVILYFCLSWTSMLCDGLEDKTFFLQNCHGCDNKLLMVEWKENENEITTDCKVLTNRKEIENYKEALDEVVVVSRKDMQQLLDDCSTKPLQSKQSISCKENDETEVRHGLPVIFPGTKWCGAGDIAKDYDDLGLHQDTDRCCRAHDLCDDIILGGESKYNLTNKTPFTLLHCKCDNAFHQCLDRVNSVTSNTVGNMYFNILKRKCYELNYPLTKKCKKYKSFLKIVCLEYERDKKKPKVYQWVKANKYKRIPFPGPLTITLPSVM